MRHTPYSESGKRCFQLPGHPGVSSPSIPLRIPQTFQIPQDQASSGKRSLPQQSFKPCPAELWSAPDAQHIPSYTLPALLSGPTLIPLHIHRKVTRHTLQAPAVPSLPSWEAPHFTHWTRPGPAGITHGVQKKKIHPGGGDWVGQLSTASICILGPAQITPFFITKS